MGHMACTGPQCLYKGALYLTCGSLPFLNIWLMLRGVVIYMSYELIIKFYYIICLKIYGTLMCCGIGKCVCVCARARLRACVRNSNNILS
jgi:hypothetical protein